MLYPGYIPGITLCMVNSAENIAEIDQTHCPLPRCLNHARCWEVRHFMFFFLEKHPGGVSHGPALFPYHPPGPSQQQGDICGHPVWHVGLQAQPLGRSLGRCQGLRHMPVTGETFLSRHSSNSLHVKSALDVRRYASVALCSSSSWTSVQPRKVITQR